MTNLDVEWAKDWMRRSSDTLTEHRMELIDLDRAMLEVLTSIRRAGADMIVTYHAKDAACWINER